MILPHIVNTLLFGCIITGSIWATIAAFGISLTGAPYLLISIPLILMVFGLCYGKIAFSINEAYEECENERTNES